MTMGDFKYYGAQLVDRALYLADENEREDGEGIIDNEECKIKFTYSCIRLHYIPAEIENGYVIYPASYEADEVQIKIQEAEIYGQELTAQDIKNIEYYAEY